MPLAIMLVGSALCKHWSAAVMHLNLWNQRHQGFTWKRPKARKWVACGAYRIRNAVTGRCYIGSSKDIEKRFRSHMHHDGNEGKSASWALDLAAHGPKSFVLEVVCLVPFTALEPTEQAQIWRERPAYNLSGFVSESIELSAAAREIRDQLTVWLL